MCDSVSATVCNMFRQVVARIYPLEVFKAWHIGALMYSLRTTDKDGWLLCDGRLLSIASYPELYDILGTTYGGDGITTFGLPDPTDQVLGVAGSTHAVGSSTGSETITLSTNQLPAHNHSITIDSNGAHTHTQTTVNDDFNNSGTYPDFTRPSYAQYDSAGSITWTNTINSNGAHTHTASSANTGSGAAINVMQPTLFIGNLFVYAGRT